MFIPHFGSECGLRWGRLITIPADPEFKIHVKHEAAYLVDQYCLSHGYVSKLITNLGYKTNFRQNINYIDDDQSLPRKLLTAFGTYGISEIYIGDRLTEMHTHFLFSER